MTTEITFTVDDDIFAKLNIALGLNDESLDETLDYCARSSFSRKIVFRHSFQDRIFNL